MTDALPLIVGAITGVGIWYGLVRPHQLGYWERRRRAAGLPPKRHLPEDDE